jgi:hypothetical protein
MDPAPAQTPHPTPFFSDVRDAKKIILFFRHIIFSLFVLKFYFVSNLSVRNIFMKKGKDPDPDPYL